MLSIFNIVFCFIGIAAGFGIFAVYNTYANKQGTHIKNESTVLLERIEKVFKIVLAEGHFSEIYDHSSEKEVLFGLTTMNKKALIVAKAKVLVGFDFAKVKIRWQEGTRTMIIEEFPAPEILSTDADYKFYDIDQGIFNKFKNEEYTALLADAKQTMQTKAIASELPKIAKKQAVVMLSQMANSMGWNIDFHLPAREEQRLLNEQIGFEKS